MDAGATAIAGGEHAQESDLEDAKKIFDAVGLTVVLDETLLDAVTGLSGSGPAYVFLILEALSDALSSLGVIVAGLVVLLSGWTLADPLVSAAIGVFIVPRTWGLLRQAVNVLLEGTPSHLALEEVERALAAASGVRRVHDLHVWTLTSGREAMSAHVVVEDLAGGERILERLHALLHARFGIDHTTIQLEREPPAVLTIKADGKAPRAPAGRYHEGGRQ